MNGIRLGCWRDGLPYGPPALSILGRFLDFILPILRQKNDYTCGRDAGNELMDGFVHLFCFMP